MEMKSISGRPKKCKECGKLFVPVRLFQVWCSPDCAVKLAKKIRAKEKKNELKQKREAIKTRSEWLKDAQAVVNAYVRLRDVDLGCISCDKPSSWQGQWHCSHFRSVGSAPHLRFNLWNMNKSCSACNNFLSGNIGAYRPRLIEKIGLERVEWIEKNQSAARHDIQYLKRIKSIFSRKTRALKKRYEERGK